MYLNRIDKKLDLVLERLNNYNSHNVRGPIDSIFLNSFPLQNVEDLKDIEENIKIENYKNKMVR